MELVDRFKKSCEKNDLSESPYNLIVFLECEELLKDKQLMKAEQENHALRDWVERLLEYTELTKEDIAKACEKDKQMAETAEWLQRFSKFMCVGM
jgi:hypothetical protein